MKCKTLLKEAEVPASIFPTETEIDFCKNCFKKIDAKAYKDAMIKFMDDIKHWERENKILTKDLFKAYEKWHKSGKINAGEFLDDLIQASHKVK